MTERKYPINGSRLYELLVLKYGTIANAGLTVGFSEHAFSNPCRRGEITEKLKIFAEKILGIPYEEYASDMPMPREAQKEKYPINGKALRDAILEKYKSVGDAGLAIGFSDSAYGNPIKRGEITQKLKIAAETILGIPYERYKADEPMPLYGPYAQSGNAGDRKAPCIYCRDECQFLADITENRFNLSVAILPKRKVLEATVAFGEEDHSVTVISDKIWINYCPNCGRAL